MAKMRAVQISKAGGAFEPVERDIPEPAPNQVRIKVEACGICHSDAFVKAGAYPGLKLPRIPGHEIAGRIDAVGAARPATGRPATASASAGTAATASCATPAGTASS